MIAVIDGTAADLMIRAFRSGFVRNLAAEEASIIRIQLTGLPAEEEASLQI